MMKTDLPCAGGCKTILGSVETKNGKLTPTHARLSFCQKCSAKLQRPERKAPKDLVQAKLDSILARISGAETVPVDVVVDLVQIISDLRKATQIG